MSLSTIKKGETFTRESLEIKTRPVNRTDDISGASPGYKYLKYINKLDLINKTSDISGAQVYNRYDKPMIHSQNLETVDIRGTSPIKAPLPKSISLSLRDKPTLFTPLTNCLHTRLKIYKFYLLSGTPSTKTLSQKKKTTVTTKCPPKYFSN